MDFVNLEMMVAMIVQHQELNTKVRARWSPKPDPWKEMARLLHADNYRYLRAAIHRFIDQAQQLRRENGGRGFGSYLALAQALIKREWAKSLELLESMGITHLDGDEPTES